MRNFSMIFASLFRAGVSTGRKLSSARPHGHHTGRCSQDRIDWYARRDDLASDPRPHNLATLSARPVASPPHHRISHGRAAGRALPREFEESLSATWRFGTDQP